MFGLSILNSFHKSSCLICFQFNIYTIISKRRPLKFRLCDCRGFEDVHGVDMSDIEAILDGNVIVQCINGCSLSAMLF
jgi:hypothetical protein